MSELPARWKTISHPSIAFERETLSSISAFISLQFGPFIQLEIMNWSSDDDKLSNIITTSFFFISSVTKEWPMKPTPPVTRIFLTFSINQCIIINLIIFQTFVDKRININSYIQLTKFGFHSKSNKGEENRLSYGSLATIDFDNQHQYALL